MEQIFIIAEIGITCNYDLELSKKLIKSAKESGADAVKFGIHFPDELMSDTSIDYTYDTANGKVTENMFDMLSSATFTLKEWKEIKKTCKDNDIEFFASIEGKTSIEWGEKLGFNYFKVGTWDVSDVMQLEQLAELNKKIIVDIGASPEQEIEDMIKIIGSENIIILHDFHTSLYSQMNMSTIRYVAEKYNVVTGFSSPSTYDINDYVAVGLGAKVIEKRLTIDRNLDGHHHVLSKTPSEFKEWVLNIRNASKSIGKYGIFPSDNDLAERTQWFKHLCIRKDIPAGTLITKEHLVCKRPEKLESLRPKDYKKLIGKTTKRDLRKNESVKLEDVE